MSESEYQAYLINVIEDLLPGAIVLKNDPRYIQGIPDLTILFNGGWAALEVKVSERAKIRPNQEYYIEHLNIMSFAAFIYPENEEQVLHELQRSFGSSGPARVSWS
jgi:hypothetical protein